MATYSSTKITNGVPARANAGENEVFASVSISANAASADVLRFFYVPANATITGIFLSSTDIDTNGTPTVTIDIGDAGDQDRLMAASQVGRAGTTDSVLVPSTGHGYKYTSETLIIGTLATVATGTTGTVRLTLRYICGDI